MRLKKKVKKITELQQVRFIKKNELKLTQDELLTFHHFMCVAVNASELFCKAHLSNTECLLDHSNLSF